MESKILVTVGMCVRNGEAHIKDAIDSVKNQDFPHELMEIVLVDDGSEDKTLSIISDSTSGIDIKTHIFHHAWKGLGPSRNVVVRHASGEYIIWVDYDNLLFSDHVQKQVDFMERNPTVGMASGRFRSRSESNTVSTLEGIEWEVNYSQNENKTASAAMGHFCGGGGGSIYRVKALRQIGGFDENIKGAGEDFDVECKITQAGWSLYVGTEAEFYHRCKKTWSALWKENYWYGYGGHYLSHKKAKAITPTFSLTRLKSHVFVGYKLTHQKKVLLFPIQQAFKKIAWLFGFLEAHFEGYGH